jgi:lipopolysaccharide export system permease protein
MGSIGRYIFRITFGAFLLVLVSLTAAIWMTQALREIDLMTSQGQTILTFVGITSLIIPQLILVIAPIALVVAVAYVLNKLATDSEIIVMNGAGMRPRRLVMPFIAVTVVASTMLAIISAYVSPASLLTLRRWITEVRADLVSNIVQPGRFISLEAGLAFNFRERRPNGLLVGLLMDDRRDPKERITIIAERGELLKKDGNNYLVLESGSIQRQETKQRDPSIVLFDRYAFDLSQFSGGTQGSHQSVHERFLWELLWPDPNDVLIKEQAGALLAEKYDRLLAPIYPFAFVLIAFAFLGAPRTTRQSATWAMTGVIFAVSGLRLIGFASTVFAHKYASAAAIQYVAVGGAIAASLYAISNNLIIEPPDSMLRMISTASDWIERRTGKILGSAQ